MILSCTYSHVHFHTGLISHPPEFDKARFQTPGTRSYLITAIIARPMLTMLTAWLQVQKFILKGGGHTSKAWLALLWPRNRESRNTVVAITENLYSQTLPLLTTHLTFTAKYQISKVLALKRVSPGPAGQMCQRACSMSQLAGERVNFYSMNIGFWKSRILQTFVKVFSIRNWGRLKRHLVSCQSLGELSEVDNICIKYAHLKTIIKYAMAHLKTVIKYDQLREKLKSLHLSFDCLFGEKRSSTYHIAKTVLTHMAHIEKMLTLKKKKCSHCYGAGRRGLWTAATAFDGENSSSSASTTVSPESRFTLYRTSSERFWRQT